MRPLALALIVTGVIDCAEGWPTWSLFLIVAALCVVIRAAYSKPVDRALRSISSDDDIARIRAMNPAPYHRNDGRAS